MKCTLCVNMYNVCIYCIYIEIRECLYNSYLFCLSETVCMICKLNKLVTNNFTLNTYRSHKTQCPAPMVVYSLYTAEQKDQLS